MRRFSSRHDEKLVQIQTSDCRARRRDVFFMHGIERSAENADFHNTPTFPILLRTVYYIFLLFSSLKRENFVKNIDMKKSAFISDVIFTFFAGALFALCLFRYLGASFFAAVALGVVCGVLLAAAFAAYRQSRRKIVFLKRSDEAQKEKLLLHLALLSDDAKTDFFRNAFSERSPTNKPLPQDVAQPVRRFGKLRLHTPNEFYFLHFRLQPVTADEVAALSRLSTGKQRTLFCAAIEDGALALCKTLGIAVQTGDEVYRYLKQNDKLPEVYLGEPPREEKRRRRLRLCFSQDSAKRYLTAGGLLLLSSLLSPFPRYYLLFGFVLLLFALLARVLGHE